MLRHTTLLVLITAAFISPHLSAQDAAAPGAAPAEPTVAEKYNAMLTLQQAITDVRKKAEHRRDLISDYLTQNNQMDAYLSSDAKPEPIERPEQFKDKGLLTYDTALQIVIDDNRADPDETPDFLPTKDTAMLQRQMKATDELGRSMWNDAVPIVRETEAMTGYVKSKGEWEKFLKWAQVATKQRDEAQAAENAIRAAEAREAREQRSREVALAVAKNRENMKKEHLERVERSWNRKVQAYQLETQRIYADKYQPRYDYRDDDYHCDYRNYRYRSYNYNRPRPTPYRR